MVNFRLPGPTPLPPAVVEAMRREMIPHRGPVSPGLLRGPAAARKGRSIGRTETSSSGPRPARLAGRSRSSTCSPPATGLSLRSAVISATASRKQVQRFGLDVRRLDVPWGEAVTGAMLGQALETHGPVQAVFLTHNETSTGVTNPLQDLTRVAVEHGALTIVDAVSSRGALPLEMDAWGVDFVLSGSQKGWMCPPGLLIAGIGGRAWEAMRVQPFPGSSGISVPPNGAPPTA